MRQMSAQKVKGNRAVLSNKVAKEFFDSCSLDEEAIPLPATKGSSLKFRWVLESTSSKTASLKLTCSKIK